MRKIILLVVMLFLFVSCSEKKENAPEQQTSALEMQPPAKELTKTKKYKIPLDSSRIVTLKDFDPKDSIMIGVRAFNKAEKEFVKRWNYTKDTELFIDVVGKICRESRPCASRLDSVAYKNDVTSILDSLMRNGFLDKAIEARKQEMNGPCFGKNYEKNFKLCNEEISKKIRKKVMEEMRKEGYVK